MGFTLVELSIFLVIIGLLIGGILVGQSLVESAQINKFISQTRELETLVRLYKDKFRQLPGDDPNALAKFGSSCFQTAVGLCNGNGNGQLIDTESATSGFETIKLWEHLYLSQILKSATIIRHTANNNSNGNSGTAPKLSLGSTAIYPRVLASDTFWTNIPNQGNHLSLTYGYFNGIINPSKAKIIDSKIDDGLMASGNVIARNGLTGVASENNCLITSWIPTSGYNMNYTQDLNGCRMLIKLDLF